MKFAHIRVSEYFTFAKQIFHSEAISLARRANFVEKKRASLRLALLFSGGERGIRTLVRVLAETRFPVVRLRPAQPSLQTAILLYTIFFFLSRGF